MPRHPDHLPRLPLQRPGWHQRAACRGTDPDRWHPQRTAPAAERAELRAICARCPVRTECLAEAFALPRDLDRGFRAGLTVDQRLRLRQARRAAS